MAVAVAVAVGLSCSKVGVVVVVVLVDPRVVAGDCGWLGRYWWCQWPHWPHQTPGLSVADTDRCRENGAARCLWEVVAGAATAATVLYSLLLMPACLPACLPCRERAHCRLLGSQAGWHAGGWLA